MPKSSRKKSDPVDDEFEIPTVTRSQMRRGVVGKYASGRKVVALDKDVVEDFPNEQAVNEALRGMLKIREIVSNLKTGKTVRRESA